MKTLIENKEKEFLRMLKKNFPGTHIPTALDFLNDLPKDIALRFLNKDKKYVTPYFRRSFVSRILMENPASFEMLEMVYTGKGIEAEVDRYAINCLGARALRSRLRSVIVHLENIILEKIFQGNKNIKILNLGSGSGRDLIDVLSKNPYFRDYVSLAESVDTDEKAIRKGREMAREKGVKVDFVQKNMLSLSYRNEIDIILIIGVLCGLEERKCITVLKRIKRYLSKGGIIIASNVMEEMLKKDPLTSYILGDILGWNLEYKTPEVLKRIFELVGYEWRGAFFDKFKFHAMGVGILKSPNY